MKRFRVFFIPALVSLLFIACAPSDREVRLDVSDRVELPDFTLESLEGERISLSSYEGVSPVLLFFWATWCPYCLREIPRITELRDRYDRSQLEILGIDLQESREEVLAYARRVDVNFPVLLDRDGYVSASFGVPGVPMLVLIDKEGRGVIADYRLLPDVMLVLEEIIE